MMNIGFDFGTTNSIISYYNQERGQLECFRITADSSPYIPSVIAYEKSGISIGESAKVQVGMPEVYSHFKLPLAGVMDEKLYQVTRDYIKALLKSFEDAGNELDRITVTIPNAWHQKDSQSHGRENLQTVFEEIERGRVQFQSEPIAAAAYFCWLYQSQQQKPYDGKLLIVDYGGGTLDVTLCEVGCETNICVLDSVGYGEERGASGCAGSAFDEEVIRILCKEHGIDLDERAFAIAKNEFEKTLIARSDACTRSMQEYFEFPEGLADEPIFRLNLLNGVEVCCKHLMQAFDKVCRPVLKDAVAQMMERHALTLQNLQVVMVGGFSNFCCVEAVVKELLHGRAGAADMRFSGILNQENKALAVAKGAALLANRVMKISEAVPEEIGFVLYGKQDGVYTDIYAPLLEKDEDVEKYKDAVYVKEQVLVMPESASTCKIRFYVGSGEKRKIYTHEINVADMLEGTLKEPTSYQVGMQIAEDGLFICMKNNEGRVWNSHVGKE